MVALSGNSKKLAAFAIFTVVCVGIAVLYDKKQGVSIEAAAIQAPECHCLPPSRSNKKRSRTVALDFAPAISWNLPSEFDVNVYRATSTDLQNLSDIDLKHHFQRNGQFERRKSNQVTSTDDFLQILSSNSRSTLEIGPFCRPKVSGRKVKYADVIGQSALKARAKAIGYPIIVCPHIDYVVPSGDLSTIQDHFDAVVTSHNIEHQVDLVGHLQQVEDILVEGGYMFLMIPDKRFMFDVPIAASTIADVLEAYYNPVRVHTLKSVVEHLALTTHNDARQHWESFQPGRLQPASPVSVDRVKVAVEKWQSTDEYIDVHKWQFTPDSFAEIIAILQKMQLTRFKVARIYPTQFGQLEFWAIIQKTSS